jgi:hypothetical protein
LGSNLIDREQTIKQKTAIVIVFWLELQTFCAIRTKRCQT